MESYNKFEIKPNQNEYIYDYNLGTNNLNNANIQKIYANGDKAYKLFKK